MKSSPPSYITITCLPSLRKIQALQGSNVFQILKEEGIPIAYACSGEGICAQCTLSIHPPEHVTPESNLEKQRKKANRIEETLRISCLCRAKGDITVQASYW